MKKTRDKKRKRREREEKQRKLIEEIPTLSTDDLEGVLNEEAEDPVKGTIDKAKAS